MSPCCKVLSRLHHTKCRECCSNTDRREVKETREREREGDDMWACKEGVGKEMRVG